MDLNTYQELARKTKMYPDEYKIIYPALGLAGEVGEVCEKIKKILRDKGGNFTDDSKEAILCELGDVTWYIANICSDLGLKMDDVANRNIEKLNSRKERNVIGGSGDNR